MLLEESIEKIDDRMQVWGSMLSKLCEAKFGKSGNTVQKQGKKPTPVSQQVQSADSSESEKSDDGEGSNQSSHDDDSSDHMTSEDEDDNSPGKVDEVPQAPTKLKGKIVEKGESQADVGSVARGGSKSGSGARPTERGRLSQSTDKQMKKVIPNLINSCE